jgi:methyltransferase (TIGR00027 family)
MTTLRARLSSTSTAESVALLRAAGALLRDERLRGPDHLAARLMPWAPRLSALVKVPVVRQLMPLLAERVVPGGVGFELARTKYMDSVVAEEVRDGAEQVVILGAGFDSRAYRMADELAAVTVFEVDQPGMSATKQARVRSAAGTPPANVHYVPVDLETTDLADALTEGG